MFIKETFHVPVIHDICKRKQELLSHLMYNESTSTIFTYKCNSKEIAHLNFTYLFFNILCL